jgi:glycosyltransferase involved in cell wall biosynthesis
MRILVVHGRYRSAAPSGENNVVDQESAALTAAGHEVTLFQRDSDEIATWSLARKATLPALTVWNPEVRRDLARRLERERPDVVHVHNTFPLLSPSVLTACHDAGVPVVATLHNYKLLCASGDFFRDGSPCHDCAGGRVTPGLRHGCYRGSRAATVPVAAGLVLRRRTWRELVSAYVFISAAQRDLMRHLALPPERVFVKHNFVVPVDASGDEPDHAVVYLGRLDAAKGLPLLMRAWDVFRSRRPRSGLRLVVAGGGPLAEEVSDWAATRSSVDVVGMLPPDEAARLLQRALAAVVPSQWEETFGLVAVEAMAAGVAPVAPGRGSFPELVTHGVNGVLFAPGDPAALAAVLADVDGEPERFRAYGRQARATYQKRFHPAANVEELLAVYRFAIENPVGGRRGLG